jgi:indole-3-glycerol phosphate synthase
VSDSQAAEEAVVLRYRGDDFLMGVPARDLTGADVDSLRSDRLGKTKPTVIKRLVESGLYTEAASEPAAPDKESEA